ncbi:MAG: hypothetical protein J3K34DRAFT_66757 [Monoraphidium minutum]|nr:MAG: hypothetical protein J3K34DRAFT_66757 [Monoraphidium minutum]
MGRHLHVRPPATEAAGGRSAREQRPANARPPHGRLGSPCLARTPRPLRLPASSHTPHLALRGRTPHPTPPFAGRCHMLRTRPYTHTQRPRAAARTLCTPSEWTAPRAATRRSCSGSRARPRSPAARPRAAAAAPGACRRGAPARAGGRCREQLLVLSASLVTIGPGRSIGGRPPIVDPPPSPALAPGGRLRPKFPSQNCITKAGRARPALLRSVKGPPAQLALRLPHEGAPWPCGGGGACTGVWPSGARDPSACWAVRGVAALLHGPCAAARYRHPKRLPRSKRCRSQMHPPHPSPSSPFEPRPPGGACSAEEDPDPFRKEACDLTVRALCATLDLTSTQNNYLRPIPVQTSSARSSIK